METGGRTSSEVSGSAKRKHRADRGGRPRVVLLICGLWVRIPPGSPASARAFVSFRASYGWLRRGRRSSKRRRPGSPDLRTNPTISPNHLRAAARSFSFRSRSPSPSRPSILACRFSRRRMNFRPVSAAGAGPIQTGDNRHSGSRARPASSPKPEGSERSEEA